MSNHNDYLVNDEYECQLLVQLELRQLQHDDSDRFDCHLSCDHDGVHGVHGDDFDDDYDDEGL